MLHIAPSHNLWFMIVMIIMVTFQVALPQDISPDDSAFCRQPHPRHRPEREVVFFASRNRTKVKTRSVVSSPRGLKNWNKLLPATKTSS